MKLAYKDFSPKVLKSGIFSTEYEPLSAAVARANEWLASASVRVVNVETVVLPNLDKQATSSTVGIRTSGEVSAYWYQVVRIWHETE